MINHLTKSIDIGHVMIDPYTFQPIYSILVKMPAHVVKDLPSTHGEDRDKVARMLGEEIIATIKQRESVTADVV